MYTLNFHVVNASLAAHNIEDEQEAIKSQENANIKRTDSLNFEEVTQVKILKLCNQLTKLMV